MIKQLFHWQNGGINMVEFLKEIKGKDFSYEKGKRYVSMSDLTEGNLKDKIFVRQPNSQKKTNWWTEFSKSDDGIVFRLLDDSEMSCEEMLEEEKILQY